MVKVTYVLSQKVPIGIDGKAWHDIDSSRFEGMMRDLAKRIKKYDPNAELELRIIEETELEL